MSLSEVPAIVHVAPWITTGGGIETLLRWHRSLDPRAGWDAQQIGLFDRSHLPGENRVTTIGAGWRDTLVELHRKFAAAIAPHRGAMVVYHNAWGLPLFADLDGARRRIAYLHAGPGYVRRFLGHLSGLVDGIVAVNPAVRALAAQTLPELAGNRLTHLHVPVRPEAVRHPDPDTARPWVVGYVGRLQRQHKRADRLPQLVREVTGRAGAGIRWEVLGDGPLRGRLQRQLGDQVVMHGWSTGEAYWRTLARWDAVVFLSESEGGPLALLECMAMGVVPFFPAIGGSLGDLYPQQVDARCYYPPGELGVLAAQLVELSRAPRSAVALWRQRAQDLVSRHTPDIYAREFADHLRDIAAAPRVSDPARPRTERWADHLPLGLITRALPGALWR